MDIPTVEHKRDWIREIRGTGDSIRRLVTGRPIRVTLLDTGFREHTVDNFRLANWKDYVSGSNLRRDSSGHGTLMAQIIHLCAPVAEISVARIAQDTETLPMRKGNIGDAILWAVNECQADIICMAFAFSLPSKEISEAISSVSQNGRPVIFLSSCGNYKARNPSRRFVQFPANDSNVMALFSLDANGKFSKTNPPAPTGTKKYVAMSGELAPEVINGEFAHIFKEYPRLGYAGSSVATAVAAGTAANILAYAEDLQEKITPDTTFAEDAVAIVDPQLFAKVLQSIKRTRNMEALLTEMAVEDSNSPVMRMNLAEFWNRFGDPESLISHYRNYSFFLNFAQNRWEDVISGHIGD